MASNDFNVLLDRKDGFALNGLEIGPSALKGRAFYREGKTGVADSMEAVLNGCLVAVPTYALIKGREFADRDDPAWNKYHDSLAERITASDEKGILGERGKLYVVNIQNGGLFVHDYSRVRDVINSGKLVNRSLVLTQEEIDLFLDALSKKDYGALKQIVKGQNVVFAGNYGEFAEESARPNFIDGISSTYVVIDPADEARKRPSDYSPTKEQIDNPDLIIAAGGKEANQKMLERALKFGWKNFGLWHDVYTTKNSGRLVGLYFGGYWLVGGGLGRGGRFVGVAPEARDAFYKGTDPLVAKVNAAVRGGVPTEHADGVILYVPRVALKQ